MAIEELDDIVEELANQLGIYGALERSEWVSEMKRRIREAVQLERKLSDAA